MNTQGDDYHPDHKKARRIRLPGVSISFSDAEGDDGGKTVGELTERQIRDEQRSEMWGVVASLASAIVGLLVGLAALFQASPFGGSAASLAAAALGTGILAAARLALETNRERKAEDVQPLSPNLRSLHEQLEEMRRPLLARSTPHTPRQEKP